MAPAHKRKLTALLLITILAAVTCWAGLEFEVLSSIENKTWDWRASLIARNGTPDPRIRLITIDQDSLDYYAGREGITWPWPRSLYIPAIKFLEAAGAKGAAFDILFTESSVQGVEDDRQFAASLRATFPVVSAVVMREKPLAARDDGYRAFIQKQQESERRHPFKNRYLSSPSIPHFPDVTLPFSELIDSSPAFGAVNGIPDRDGIFRHALVGGFQGETPILSLPFSLFHAAGPERPGFSVDPDALTVRFQGLSGAYGEDNMVNIISSYVAMTEGRKPAVNPARYKDAFVFIGVTAPGLLDHRPTSVDRLFRGVEFNAAALDNLLHDNFIKKAPLWWGMALTVLGSLLLAGYILFAGRAASQVLGIVCVTAAFFFGEYLLASAGYWTPLAVPFLCLVGAILLALAFQYQLEGRERKFIQGAFGMYVSPRVIDRILADPSNLSLGGERRELTIFFSDIQGFTTISERMEPAKLVQFLNRYLTEMTEVILSSGGTLDKYEGDAIIAFWNAPLLLDDHPLRAVNAALLCQARLRVLEKFFADEFGVQPTTRMGLHTGHVTVGNFGSKNRFDYTVIGDAANLASRLEGVNKVFGTKVLVSEALQSRCNDAVPMRKVGAVQVVGKSQAVTVFEPLDGAHPLDEADRKIFAEALWSFELGDIAGAKTGFEKLPKDPVSEKYLRRIASLPTGIQENWSPVWLLESK